MSGEGRAAVPPCDCHRGKLEEQFNSDVRDRNPIEALIANELFHGKKSSKLGWKSRVCGRIGIIDYLDINRSRLSKIALTLALSRRERGRLGPRLDVDHHAA
jgi:hypothetical protein